MKYKTITSIACALVCGCASNQGTKEYSIDSPWNSPGNRSITSEHTYLPFMAAGSTSDLYWTLSSGRRVEVEKYSKKLEEYLLNVGYIDAWPGTGSHINDIEQKNAPYRLFFVSIDPVVVLMVPWAHSPDKPRDVEGMRTNPRQQKHTDYLRFPFEFGTRIPYADELIAIHLDGTAERKLLIPAKDITYTLEFEDTTLMLTREDETWVIIREK